MTRRVWDCIPFGYEIAMLWLHVQTVQRVVDEFLIVESATTHTTKSTKPLVLSEYIANGTVPSTIDRSKLNVHVVPYRSGSARYCRGGKWVHNPVRCFEGMQVQADPLGATVAVATAVAFAKLCHPDTLTLTCFPCTAFQRFVLVEKVLERAAPNDLALFGDVDEIPRPDVVSALSRCHLLAEDADFRMGGGSTSAYALKLSLFKYGVHCAQGNTFALGTRAFSVKALQLHYGGFHNASPSDLGAMSVDFTLTRERPNPKRTLAHAGWHLTSFGEPWELARKMSTWMHANLFDDKENALDLARLDRCARFCLEVGGREAVMPLCRGRGDPRSRKLPGAMVTDMATFTRGPAHDLPPPLLTDRADYPASWFRHLLPIR